MKTQRERDAEKREEKLKEINEAVSDGKLVIRQMTPEERERIGPPREPRPRRSR
jgi:hypothetical protein